MVWGNIKRGDAVIVIMSLTRHRIDESGRYVPEAREIRTPGVAVAVGAQWITVEVEHGRPKRQRFDATNGFGEYNKRVHTEQTLADETRRAELVQRIERSHVRYLPMETLEAIVRLLPPEQKRRS